MATGGNELCVGMSESAFSLFGIIINKPSGPTETFAQMLKM